MVVKKKAATDIKPYSILVRVDTDPKQIMVHVGLIPDSDGSMSADELDAEIRRELEDRKISFDDYYIDHLFAGQQAPLDTSFMGIVGVIKNLTDDLDTELVRQVNLGNDNWLLMLDNAAGVECLTVDRVQDSYNVTVVMDGVDMCDGFDWLVEQSLQSQHDDFEYIKHMDNPC